MKIYALTDEIAEDVVSVFLAKNDRAAIKRLELDLKSSGKDLEMNLYALDVEVGFDEKFYAFYDDGDDKESRLIYSYPMSYVSSSEEVRKEITKESIDEEK